METRPEADPCFLCSDGSVAAGVASVQQFENHFTPDKLEKHHHQLANAPLVILDGNLPESTIQVVLQRARRMLSDAMLPLLPPNDISPQGHD